MDCGIRPDDFWEYSLGDIRELMESYARSEKRKARNEIAARYELADLIGLYIQVPYDEKKEIKIPKVWDTYPELFSDERDAYDLRNKGEALERARVSRMEYAAKYNEMRRQRGQR